MSEDKPISETVSKKGRPPVFSPAARRAHALMHPEIKTVRGQLNLCYRQAALEVIWGAKNPKLDWLGNFEKMKAGTDDWQPTILIELGKLWYEPEALLAIAERICELKPKTRDAVAMIRQFRLGEREPDTLQLANEIIHTLNDYRKRFPKLTDKQTVDALATACAQVTKKAKRKS